MRWQEEKTKKDIANRHKGNFNTEGVFWYDYMRKYKDDPKKRYEIAISFLPLPAAFREAVLALRTLIREQKKLGVDFTDNLSELYCLAVWFSFCPTEYSERAQCVSYNIFERFAGGKITNFDADYQDIGYEELKLINKTDAKLLVNIYGEPKSHSTLNKIFIEEWLKEEDSFIAERKKNSIFW